LARGKNYTHNISAIVRALGKEKAAALPFFMPIVVVTQHQPFWEKGRSLLGRPGNATQMQPKPSASVVPTYSLTLRQTANISSI